jgi:hypothetical protein
VDQVSILLESRDEDGRIETVDPIELVGPGDLAGVRVPFPAADLRGLLRFRKPGFAQEKVGFDLLAAADVGRDETDGGGEERAAASCERSGTGLPAGALA